MPSSRAPSTASKSASSPAACPSVRFRPRRVAHRPLPSITQATWAGMRSRSRSGGQHDPEPSGRSGMGRGAAGYLRARVRPRPLARAVRLARSSAQGQRALRGHRGRPAVVVHRVGRVPLAVPAAPRAHRGGRLRVVGEHGLRRPDRGGARAGGPGRRGGDRRDQHRRGVTAHRHRRRPDRSDLGGPRRRRRAPGRLQRGLADHGARADRPGRRPRLAAGRGAALPAHVLRWDPWPDSLPGPVAFLPVPSAPPSPRSCSRGRSASSATSRFPGERTFPARVLVAIGFEILKLVGTVSVPRAMVTGIGALRRHRGGVRRARVAAPLRPADRLRRWCSTSPVGSRREARSPWRSRCPASAARFPSPRTGAARSTRLRRSGPVS